MKTPANLGAAFVRSTKPKPNCRLERPTYKMTAVPGSSIVSFQLFGLINLFVLSLSVLIKISLAFILFNIAAKSDGITSFGNSTDPILSIFLKVFNELQGYDPQYPEIAEIERYLESIGKYENLQD